jgi:hypothetical protein
MYLYLFILFLHIHTGTYLQNKLFWFLMPVQLLTNYVAIFERETKR